MDVCTYVDKYICVYVNTCTYLICVWQVRMCTCVHVCMYVYMCMYVYIHGYVCEWWIKSERYLSDCYRLRMTLDLCFKWSRSRRTTLTNRNSKPVTSRLSKSRSDTISANNTTYSLWHGSFLLRRTRLPLRDRSDPGPPNSLRPVQGRGVPLTTRLGLYLTTRSNNLCKNKLWRLITVSLRQGLSFV